MIRTTPPSTAEASPRSQPPSQPLSAQSLALAARPPPLATNTPPSSPPLSASATPLTTNNKNNNTNDSRNNINIHNNQYTINHSRIGLPPRPNYTYTKHRRHTSASQQSRIHNPSSRTASFALAAADGNAKRNVPQLSESHRHELPHTILGHFFRRWLPSLFSPHPIRHTFPRNLDTAVRALIAFIVAAVIAVQPWALNLLSVPYLFLVFAVITVRSTVGQTLINIEAQGKVKCTTSRSATDWAMHGRATHTTSCAVLCFVTGCAGCSGY